MGQARRVRRARSIDDAAKDKGEKSADPVGSRVYTSAAIIMLTDGQRTTGVGPDGSWENGGRPRRAGYRQASAPSMATIVLKAGRCAVRLR